MIESKTFTGTVTKSVTASYYAYLPEGYDSDAAQKWPLIFFLHGAGERGDDLSLMLVHGPIKHAQETGGLPFVIIAPQCPDGEVWDSDTLGALLDEVISAYRVDPDRVYLTGISMGGFGTWDLAQARPEAFAAIAPICGWCMPLNAHKIKDLPIWAFHGDADDVVPMWGSQSMVNTLQAMGAPEVKFTVYPGVGHDSWTQTYRNPELYEWFLAHRRG